MVLALSEDHGLDAADLPALPLAALALAVQRRRAGGRMAAVAAVALGLLLIAGVLVRDSALRSSRRWRDVRRHPAARRRAARGAGRPLDRTSP